MFRFKQEPSSGSQSQCLFKITVMVPLCFSICELSVFWWHIIVADVRYARVSTSIPTVNMWCAHTANANNPMAIKAKIIPRFPNTSLFPLSWQMMCEIIPDPGRMRM